MNCYVKANEKNSMTFTGDKIVFFLDVYDVLEDSSIALCCLRIPASLSENRRRKGVLLLACVESNCMLATLTVRPEVSNGTLNKTQVSLCDGFGCEYKSSKLMRVDEN